MTEFDFDLLHTLLLLEYPHFNGYEEELYNTLYYTHELLGGEVTYSSADEMRKVYNQYLNSVSLFVGVETYVTAVISHNVQEYLVESVEGIDLDSVWDDEGIKRILALPEMSNSRLSEAEILKICDANLTDEDIADLIEQVVEDVCEEALQIMMQYYVEDLMVSEGKTSGMVNVTIDAEKFVQELLDKSIEFNNLDDLCQHLAKNYNTFLVNKNGDDTRNVN